MTERANYRDRMLAFLVIVATIATIAFNGLAAAGLINDITPDILFDKYLTVLTPAGYAFSIWSVIYFGIAAFSVYQFFPANLVRFRAVRSLYIFTYLLNCGWIYFWHREQIGICLVLILTLLVALFLLLIVFERSGSSRGSLFIKAPFGIYAGWATIVAIVNFAIYLKYKGVELSPLGWNTLGVILIIFASVTAMIVRWKLRNYLYPLVVAWGFTAIAIKQGGNTAIVVAAAIGVVICLVTAGSFVVDLKDSTSE